MSVLFDFGWCQVKHPTLLKQLLVLREIALLLWQFVARNVKSVFVMLGYSSHRQTLRTI